MKNQLHTLSLPFTFKIGSSVCLTPSLFYLHSILWEMTQNIPRFRTVGTCSAISCQTFIMQIVTVAHSSSASYVCYKREKAPCLSFSINSSLQSFKHTKMFEIE